MKPISKILFLCVKLEIEICTLAAAVIEFVLLEARGRHF